MGNAFSCRSWSLRSRCLPALFALATGCASPALVPAVTRRVAPSEAAPPPAPVEPDVQRAPLPPLPAPFSYEPCDLDALVPAPPPLPATDLETQRLVEQKIAALAERGRELHDEPHAIYELRQLGPPAVAALVRILERKGCRTRKRQRVQFCNGSGQYDAPCCGDRVWAARVLGRFGAMAAGAVPALARAQKGPSCDVDVPIGVTVGDLPMTEQLPRAASRALAELGPYGAAIVAGNSFGQMLPTSSAPFLLKRLARATDGDSCTVMENLAAMQPAPVEAVPALIRALRGNAAGCAVYTLRSFGPLAFDAAVPLTELLADRPQPAESEDAPSAHRIVEAVGYMGPAASESVPALVAFTERAVAEEAWNDADAALRALALIRTSAPSAVQLFASLTDHPNVGWWASEALGRSGAAGIPFFGRLREGTTEWFFLLISAGRTKPDWALPLLLAALRDDARDRQASAAKALGRLGPSAAPAIPALLELLGPKDRDLLTEASTEACPDSGDDECRWDVVASVIRALGEIGQRGAIVVPRLIALAQHEPTDQAPEAVVRIHDEVVLALGGFPDQAAQSVPVLVSLLPEPYAMSALGRLGSAARAAVPALRAHIAAEPTWAEDALAKIEAPPRDPEASWRDLEYLEVALSGYDDALRERAKHAVRALMIERLKCPTSLP